MKLFFQIEMAPYYKSVSEELGWNVDPLLLESMEQGLEFQKKKKKKKKKNNLFYFDTFFGFFFGFRKSSSNSKI